MPLISDSDARFNSFRIVNLVPSSFLITCSDSAKASTIADGRERIAGGLEIGLPEQMADAAVQELQLVMTQVFDHADDVARHHRLVHRMRVDERKLVGLQAQEVGLGDHLARDAVVHLHPQPPLEFRQEVRLALLQGIARAEATHLFLAHVGAARPVHQHFADAIEHGAKRIQQAMNGDIAAIAENPHRVARERLPVRRFGCGRVHGRREKVMVPLVYRIGILCVGTR